MEIRNAEEEKVLDAADLSLEQMRDWTEEVFKKGKYEKDFVSAEIQAWVSEHMRECYARAKTEKQRRMMLVKVIHTREVVEAGLDIVSAEMNKNWNLPQVGAICMLHDVARFDQALLGSFSDSLTGFDHAWVGAAMIEEADWSVGLRKQIDMPVVAEAVRWHSAYAYKGTDKYAKVIRDADKLGLVRYIDYHLKAMRTPDGAMNKQAIEQFLRRETVLKTVTKTKADIYLSWLAWKWDLNFAETKRRFIDEGMEEWLCSRIKACDPAGAIEALGLDK